jgi:hypothetical protein
MVGHLLKLASHLVGGLAMLAGGGVLMILISAVLYVTLPEPPDGYDADQSSILSKILCRWHSIQGNIVEPGLPT